jgi:hypothetical protein
MAQISLKRWVEQLDAAALLYRHPSEVRVDELPQLLEDHPDQAVFAERVGDCDFPFLLAGDELSVGSHALRQRIIDEDASRADETGFMLKHGDRALIGPFNAFLRSPETAGALLDCSAAAEAAHAGLDAAVIADLRQGTVPSAGLATRADRLPVRTKADP